mgnify:FL=1
MALTGLPILLAWIKDRELDWQPARWLSVTILLVCLVYLWVPGYTADRPRDMNLIYNEAPGSQTGQLVLESIYRRPDMDYANGHDFVMTPVDYGWPEPSERPIREVPLRNLPGLTMTMQSIQNEGMSWRRRFVLDMPESTPMVQLVIASDQLLEKAWVNGLLALDKSIQDKNSRPADRLRVIYPGAGPLEFELLTGSDETLTFAAVTWYPMPAVLTAPFMGNWPEDAQPFLYPPRAQKVQRFELKAGAHSE